MKKGFVLLLAGVMFLGIGTTVMAASDTSDIEVSVAAIDALTVTDGGTITLDDVTGGVITGDPDTTADLSYTHNLANNRMITAEATTVPGGQTITLTVSVAGGAGERTLVNAGTGQSAQQVWNNIPRGAITDAEVTYSASATAAGTPAGSYTFTVTFTSTDQT